MPRIGLIALITVFALAACQSSTQQELPTLVQFPTETDTPPATATFTATVPTATPTLTETPLPSSTPTETVTASITPIPSETAIPTDTPDATQVAVGTATAAVAEAPHFATFTPLPPGAVGILVRPTSTGRPEVMADVVITEAQFQEEVNRQIADDPDISQAQVDFVAETGVKIQLTARSSDAFVTGDVTVPFNFSGGTFNNIVMIGGLVDIEMRDGVEPSEDFLGHVTTSVLIVQESFNFILNQRLGEGNHNLEQIFITDEVIGVSLLVPDPGQ